MAPIVISSPYSYSTSSHNIGLSCTIWPQYTTRQTDRRKTERWERAAYAIASAAQKGSPITRKGRRRVPGFLHPQLFSKPGIWRWRLTPLRRRFIIAAQRRMATNYCFDDRRMLRDSNPACQTASPASWPLHRAASQTIRDFWHFLPGINIDLSCTVWPQYTTRQIDDRQSDLNRPPMLQYRRPNNRKPIIGYIMVISWWHFGHGNGHQKVL